jgi:hypothetical protein
MYASPDDLRTMQALVQEAWRLAPKNERHVGDLAWGAHQHVGREPEWARRLWLEDGKLVAYGWLCRPETTLDWQLHPHRPELLDRVLDWFEPEVGGMLVTSRWPRTPKRSRPCGAAGTQRSKEGPGSPTWPATWTGSPGRTSRAASRFAPSGPATSSPGSKHTAPRSSRPASPSRATAT